MNETLAIEGSEGSSFRVKARLGILALAGFQPLPNLLLLHQCALGLSSEEMNVYLNIYIHWHEPDTLPFVNTATIARRMDVGIRAVQRAMKNLIAKGYIIKVKPRRRGDLTRYDIRPLLKRLEPYARQRIALVGERSFDEMAEYELAEDAAF